MYKSLRLQLLLGLLAPLALIVSINVSIAYRNAALTAGTVTDRTLLASAKSIAETVRMRDHQIEAVIPPAALGMFDTGHGDLVYYRVTGPDGNLAAGYPELPAPPHAVGDVQPYYYDAKFRDERIRLVAVMQPVPAATRTREALVVVAETLHAHDAMVAELWTEVAEQQGILVVIAAGLAWLGLRRDLAPLVRLGREVARRKPHEFQAFSTASVQSELRPFVNALNLYMQRLSRQVEAQRRFTANAAHQLRTPLTLLRAQAQYALRKTGEGERNETVQAILRTSKQLTRLTNQLLTLFKAEPDGRPARRDAVDLPALTRRVLEEYVEVAIARGVDLGFEGGTTGAVTTPGDPALLREMVANLVENAVQYTPEGGIVTVSVAREGFACLLRVHDNGPGIPLAERELVFERFYRVLGTQGEGSGLGLAIVKEIADAHGGSITLSDPPEGTGLVVDVRLPVGKLPPPDPDALCSDVAERRGTPLQ